jgi:tetratricopeptide (TPR) repeat protein
VTLVAGLVSPNLWRGFVYPLQALAQFQRPGPDLRQLIDELAPIRSLTHLPTTARLFELSLIWAAAWVVGTVGRVSLLRIVVLAGTAAVTFMSYRAIGFYALAFYLVHSGCRGDRPTRFQLPARFRLSARAAAVLERMRGYVPAASLLAAVVVAALWLPAIVSDRFYLREGVFRRSGRSETPALFAHHAVAELARRKSSSSPAVFNTLDAASVIIDRGAGRVFIDGRTEAYPVDLWSEYLAIQRGGEAALEAIERRQADAVVIGHYSPANANLVRTLVGAPAWALAAVDEAGALFLPAGGDGHSVVPESAAAAARAVLERAIQKFIAGLPAEGGVRAADRCQAMAWFASLVGSPRTEELFRRGLDYDPDHPILNNNLGGYLLAQKRPDDALVHLERALTVLPGEAQTLVNAGLASLQVGAYAQAEAYLTDAVARDAGRWDAWYYLAELRRARGDIGGARDAYFRARALRPGDPNIERRLRSLGRARPRG